MSPKQYRILLGVVVVLLTGALFFATRLQLQRDDVLPVTEVQLNGVFQNLSENDLQNAVLPLVTGNFFTIDVEAIHAAASQLPWVKHVWVDRIWPDTLRVRVQEQLPVAVWNNESLINFQAEVFVSNSGHELLPHLYGPNVERERILRKFSEASRLLEKNELQINKLSADARLAWRMQLNNGIELILGRDKSKERLERFVRVYNNYLKVQKDKIARVDMRYANGFAVSWRDGDSKTVKS